MPKNISSFLSKKLGWIQRSQNQQLSYPNCKNELELENWKVFINCDETRIKDAEILNWIEKSFNSNKYINKSINLFKFILNKMEIIHPMIKSQKKF